MMKMKWSAVVVASVVWMCFGMLILAGCYNTGTDGQTTNSSTGSDAQPGDEIEDDEAASDDETGDDETPDDETPDDETPDDETPDDETPDDETPDDETDGDETGESSNVPTKNPVVVAGDWSQWGGNSLRNNVPIGKGIPIEWEVGKFDRKTRAWDPSSALNIKWVARVGSQTYGNPVISGGRLFVGTNNSAGYLKRYGARVDLGCLICFDEATGKFLWQHSSEKLPTGRVHDWPLQGICCAPLVEGNRLWFVGSRGEVICLDSEGYYDGEDDGAVKNELARLFDIRQGPDPKTDTVAPAIAALKEGKLTEAVLKAFAGAGMELPAEVMVTGADSGKQWNVQALVGNSDRDLVIKLQGPEVKRFQGGHTG